MSLFDYILNYPSRLFPVLFLFMCSAWSFIRVINGSDSVIEIFLCFLNVSLLISITMMFYITYNQTQKKLINDLDFEKIRKHFSTRKKLEKTLGK